MDNTENPPGQRTYMPGHPENNDLIKSRYNETIQNIIMGCFLRQVRGLHQAFKMNAQKHKHIHTQTTPWWKIQKTTNLAAGQDHTYLISISINTLCRHIQKGNKWSGERPPVYPVPCSLHACCVACFNYVGFVPEGCSCSLSWLVLLGCSITPPQVGLRKTKPYLQRASRKPARNPTHKHTHTYKCTLTH